MQIWGPERAGGQGLDANQEESGNRAILALLTDPETRDLVDLVLTFRREGRDPENGEFDAGADEGAYEVWSRRGMVRFRRYLSPEGQLEFEVIETLGEDPIANRDASALRTVAEEVAAALASKRGTQDATMRFIAPEHQSYPFAYERIAQLFDSPNAPDLAISPCDWAQGPYAGNHGALHVRQSRGPLWFKGPRIRAGRFDVAVRAVDIAPTVLAALGFPLIDGADASGRTSSERGAAPDVYLRRQDGRPIEELLETSGPTASHVYVFLLDGIHMTELSDRLASESEASLPNLRRLHEGAAVLASGSIVNFPSITWPSHTSICTGSWCGHHDVVNPSYYLRDKRESVSPQGQQSRTEGFASAAVESLYEAIARVRGPDAWSAAIHAPFGRGADHAVLEGRNLGDRPRLKALTLEIAGDCDTRWERDGHEQVINESVLDNRGMAQVIELFSRPDRPPPDFVYHEMALTDGAGHDYGPHDEGLKAALDETDRRIGRVLDLLEARGIREDTLFVLTADHGMAPQDRSQTTSPPRHIEKIGLRGWVAEPMIWLRDLAVDVERAADGRTGRVIVSDNDALATGERPAIEGVSVVVSVQPVANAEGDSRAPAAEPRVVARGRTGPGGLFGFATPPELATCDLVATIDASGAPGADEFNPRRVRLDGVNLAVDLRAELYGAASEGAASEGE